MEAVPVYSPPPPDPCEGSIIAGHNAVLAFDTIPVEFLTAAKELRVHFASASHGRQINEGTLWLENQDNTYGVAIRRETTEGLPPQDEPHVVRIYTGCPPERSCDHNDYYQDEVAMNRTRAVLNTGNYDISWYQWCNQFDWFSETRRQTYLTNMAQLESEYPNIIFIYATARLCQSDGRTYCNERERENVYNQNQAIRQYCIENNKILFDFADIDSMGGQCLSNAYYDEGFPVECDWPAEPDFMCPHSKGESCVRKAKAFWWLMARLAGWCN
jgi:hypothetical protein